MLFSRMDGGVVLCCFRGWSEGWFYVVFEGERKLSMVDGGVCLIVYVLGVTPVEVTLWLGVVKAWGGKRRGDREGGGGSKRPTSPGEVPCQGPIDVWGVVVNLV